MRMKIRNGRGFFFVIFIFHYIPAWEITIISLLLILFLLLGFISNKFLFLSSFVLIDETQVY